MNMVYAVNGSEAVSSVQEDFDRLEQWKVGKETITQTAVEHDGVIVRDNSKLKVVNGVIEYDAEAVVAQMKEESRKQYKAEYQESIFNCEVEVDGMVFQTRDTDASKIQFAISTNTDEFRLKDNSVVSVTIDQLNEVYALGVAKIKVTNDTYNAQLKALQ